MLPANDNRFFVLAFHFPPLLPQAARAMKRLTPWFAQVFHYIRGRSGQSEMLAYAT